MQPAPLRSLNDYFLVFARFQFPNFSDSGKWGNRVKCNLIYYQSNYFLTWISILLLVGLFHPVKLLLGIISLTTCFFLHKLYLTAPTYAPAAAVLGVCIIFYLIDSIVILMFGIFISISATFLHATLRLRDFDNKIVNMMSAKGDNMTPMDVLLDRLYSLKFLQSYKFFQIEQSNRRQNEVDKEVLYESETSETIIHGEKSFSSFSSNNSDSSKDVNISSTYKVQRNSAFEKNVGIAKALASEGMDKATEKLGLLSNHLKKLRKN